MTEVPADYTTTDNQNPPEIYSQTYHSSKKFGPISVAHRQWRAESHCRFIHGYGRSVELTFECAELDHHGWVMDFGNLKSIKKRIEQEWDHRLLVASDDPKLNLLRAMHQEGLVDLNVLDVYSGHNPGIEGSCTHLYDILNPMVKKLTDQRVRISKVQIWEHENNSATVEMKRV